MKVFLDIIAVAILFLSCEEPKDELSYIVKIDNELVAELNSLSSDTLVLDSNRYILEAFVYRNFMPTIPESDLDLIKLVSLNRLVNLDSIRIPDQLELVEQYVIRNDSVWIAEYVDREDSTIQDFKIEKVSINGPPWAPEIFVDIISKIRDNNTMREYYIRLRKVNIQRVS